MAWAEAGIGTVATQSFIEVRYGVAGLELMRTGLSAQRALAVQRLGACLDYQSRDLLSERYGYVSNSRNLSESFTVLILSSSTWKT